MQFWNELEGRTIDGRHPLRRLVRSEGRSAWFESEAGDPQKSPATVSLTEALTDADEVSDRLRSAQGIKHPNLVSITKVGQVNLDNTLFVYAVMEHIEQSLSDVLESQALSAEEAREVAEALVGSLTAIHQKGMSHGHVEAASVLATEETVKLRSDCLQAGTAGQADDVAGIGATLFHAFTQRKGLSATDAQVNRIPAPFAEIVRNSFAHRWTLAQVANALKPVAPLVEPVLPTVVIPAPEPVVAKAPPPVPVARPAAPKPTPPRPAASRPAPPVAAERSPVPAIDYETINRSALIADSDAPVPASRKGLPLYLGAGAVLLALIAWLVFRPGSTPAPAPATSPQPAAQVAPAPAPPPPAPAITKKPSAAVAPMVHTPKAQPVVHTAATPVTTTTPAASDRPIWRVIAYTYRRQEAAAEMVSKISAKHPNLKVEVFSPHGKSDIYLVSLGGGGMDHAEAIKMLDKVRSMDLAEDCYIQNFSE